MRYEEKQSLRQRWLPTADDATQASGKSTGGLGILVGRYLRTVAVAGVLLYTGCNVVGNNWQYSDGARVGVVNKFTKSGLVWKTHEGEMALEGLVSSGSGTSANLWHFSIDDQARNGENKQALVKEIADALNSGKKVKITYKEMVETWPWRSGTDYLVQSVEPLQPKQ